MHHGECSCYQGLQNIELKVFVLKEPDCVMIWMNWFNAEKKKFLQRQIPKCSGRSVLITCCGLFLSDKIERAGGSGREKRDVCLYNCRGMCVLLSLLHCAFIYSSKMREDIPSSLSNTSCNRKG